MFEIQKKSPPSADLTALGPPASEKPPLASPASRAAVPASQDSGNGVFFLIDAFRRWWKWVLPAGLILGIGGAALVLWLFVPYYEAVSWLRIDAHQQYIAFESKIEDRDANRLFVNTQIALMRNPIILGPVLANPEIARMPEIASSSDPLDWLAKQISVKQESESELYRVAYAAPSPQSAATVVNAIVDQYFQLRKQEDDKRNFDVGNKLAQEHELRKEALRKLREEVRDLAKQTTGQDPFAGGLEPATVVNHPLAGIQDQMIKAEVEQEEIKARIRVLQEIAAPPLAINDTSIESKLEIHPEILRLKQDLMAMRSQLRNLESISVRKDKIPGRQQLVRQIAETETALANLKKELAQMVRQEMQASQSGKHDDQLVLLRSQLESRRTTTNLLREKYENQVKDMKQTSGDTVQLRLKQGELDRAEKIDALIAERILKLKTEVNAPDRVVRLQRASVPTMPLVAFPYRNILLAAIAGFGFPFALVLGWERITRRVGDAANLETEARHRVLGEIARLPSRPVGERTQIPRRMGFDLRMYEESVDSLRTTLMLEETLQDVRILAVTSAINHEGKTSVAAQLALSLERATESPVLLIDGDMRSPDMHAIFNTPLEPGLTNVLEGKCSIEEAVVPIGQSHLDVLPAGKLKSNPHQLLGNGARDALRRAIPEKYRYVIIDSPPILAASEALVLAALADASVVCTLRDVSRIDQVRKAYDRLQTTGGHPVGLVLNGVPPKSYANRYGSYAYESNSNA